MLTALLIIRDINVTGFFFWNIFELGYDRI